jgi:ABC-type proline/glycine betaine transport system ATPase subunit
MEPLQNITEPPPSEAEPADELKPFCVQTLESIMVFITTIASEKCTICQMVDFLMQGSSGNVTIESLAFDRFTSILKEDIQFDSTKYNIFYHCTKGMAVAITNE